MATKKNNPKAGSAGRLRIGDDWHAITIIALSQSNPLKALAEFVENSIDAGAKRIQITRARVHGEHYIQIIDDGSGIPRDEAGIPNFRYVATHICDSLKRRLKTNGATGIQGEFGIGLLSFWTVGEELTLVSSGADGKTYQMRMRKGDPSYTVTPLRRLLPEAGTELTIKPLLTGLRQFSGDKIQWYLASELRDRIRHSGVDISIIDRHARKTFVVEPRRFNGRLLHQLGTPRCDRGDIYLELYLTEPGPDSRAGLYRAGTRVLESIAELDAFNRPPWTAGYLQGIVDAPFLTLTPGTRTGVIQDASLGDLITALEPVEDTLNAQIAAQQLAEEEQQSQRMLRTIRKAFREALLALPAEEYDWFDIHAKSGGVRPRPGNGKDAASASDNATPPPPTAAGGETQLHFFEHPGPLFRARIAPASSVLPVGESRTFQALASDRARRAITANLRFSWEIADGAGRLDALDREIVTFYAPGEPGLTRLQVTVTHDARGCLGEATITVTDSLPTGEAPGTVEKEGMPGYTFQRAPGELWRSRYDAENNVIVINNGHRDFVFASRNKTLKLRYIIRLFAKEMVYKNFPGYAPEQLLERLIELSLYTEEHLR